MARMKLVARRGRTWGGEPWVDFLVEVDGRRYRCGGGWLGDGREVVEFFDPTKFARSTAEGLETLRLLAARGILAKLGRALPAGDEPADQWSSDADRWYAAYDRAANAAQKWAARRLRFRF